MGKDGKENWGVVCLPRFPGVGRPGASGDFAWVVVQDDFLVWVRHTCASKLRREAVARFDNKFKSSIKA